MTAVSAVPRPGPPWLSALTIPSGGPTRTCLGCAVDWNTPAPCWICGRPGASLDLLPAAVRAEHFMSGHAVLSPSTGDGTPCPL